MTTLRTFTMETPAYIRLLEYIKLDRRGILDIAFADAQYGDWFKAEQDHLSFFDLTRLMLQGEFGRDAANDAVLAYINRDGRAVLA